MGDMGMNLDELERLYREATPGEWRSFKRTTYFHLKTAGSGVYVAEPISGRMNFRHGRDTSYIAALHNAFPALLALARDGERYREMEQKLRDFADAEYVRGIDMATHKAACQGSEAKLAFGTFGAEELKAHEKMNRHFGAHFGIHAAIDAARKGEKP